MSHSKFRRPTSSRVLIAEDHEDTRTMLCRFLCGGQVRCDPVEDGIAAMAAYRKAREAGDPYALLILDGAMPRATGYEVTDYVRKEAGDSGTPILLVTGSTDPLVRPHAIYSGATEVFYKPLDPEKFKARVTELLNGAASAGGIPAVAR